MSFKIILIALVVSILANIFLVWGTKKSAAVKRNAISSEANYMAESKNGINNELLLKSTMHYMTQQFKNEDVPVPGILPLANGDQLNVRKLCAQQETLLVYRFDKNTCSSCIDNDLANISKLSRIFESRKMVIFTSSFYTAQQAKVYAARFEVPCEIYNVKPGSFKFTTEASLIPCYFVLDKSLRATLFFTPDKNNNEMTNRYFEVLAERGILQPK